MTKNDESAESYEEDDARHLTRTCMECGKTIEITVYEDDTYERGHYFGEFTLPDEDSDGEYEKTGEWEGHDVVEWTGEEDSLEYWECDDCFSSRQAD